VSRKTDPTPATLAEAKELLGQRRPKRDAGPRAWVAFHRHCAEVYAQVAKADLAHRFEAQAYAGQETRQAREIEEQLADS
jgi:hypothetical protein